MTNLEPVSELERHLAEKNNKLREMNKRLIFALDMAIEALSMVKGPSGASLNLSNLKATLASARALQEER